MSSIAAALPYQANKPDDGPNFLQSDIALLEASESLEPVQINVERWRVDGDDGGRRAWGAAARR